jgi:DNA-binding NarL/FixJ family response regulator
MTERSIILIVDDEQSARATIEALLQTDQYSLLFASGGSEALALLEKQHVDLVISDVMMPKIDGLELCRKIKAHPQWRFIPVILVTALDGQDDMVRGLEAGADEFLSKPIERVVLRARVRAMLRVRAHYNQLRTSAADVDSLLRNRREQIVSGAKLSAREREVLELLLLGRTHEDIGTALGITARTSKFHQENILQKLGAESRIDLARLFL